MLSIRDLSKHYGGLQAVEGVRFDAKPNELSDIIRGFCGNGHVVVLVEHDMDMVMGISDHIVVMNFGTPIAEGAP